jgi:hypothetical protein
MVLNEQGRVSHKRIIGYICTICMCTKFLMSPIVDPTLSGSLEIICIVAIGGTVAERFASRPSKDLPASPTEQ